MPREMFRRSENLEMFQIEETLLQELEDAGLIEPLRATAEAPACEEPCYHRSHVENIRVAVALTRELEIDLPAAEIILRMRERILAMQRQVREFLQVIAREFSEE